MDENMERNVKLQIGNESALVFSMEYGCNFYFENIMFFES